MKSVNSGGRRFRRSAPLTLLGALALVAALLVAVGCGDNSSSNDGSASGSTQGGSAPKGTPIKLAGLIDVSGPNNGGQGEAVPVLQAWVKDANAHGGVAGHPVELQIFDTQSNPSKAAGAAQQIIADRSIVGVVSVDAATETNSLKTFSNAGVPVIGGTDADPTVWGTTKVNKYFRNPPLPGVFTVATAFPAQIAGFIAAGQANGARNMVSVNFSQVPASRNGTDLANAMASAVGMKASSITVDASAPNFTAECLQIVQKKADYVTFFTPPTLAGRVVQDCNTQGYRGAYGATGGGVTKDIYDHVGANKLIGAWFSFPSYARTSWGDAYRTAMDDQGVDEAVWKGANGPTAWSSVELFRKTLEADKAALDATVTRKNVLAAYGKVKNETLEGMLPSPVTYTKGDVTTPACYWLFSYENGEFSGDSAPSCPAKSLGAG